MCRSACLAGLILSLAALSSGCTVHVDEPADTPKVDVEVDRPKPNVDVDVDVKPQPGP